MGDDGDDVKGLVSIDSDGRLLEGGKLLGDRSAAGDNVRVERGKDRGELVLADSFELLRLVELVAPADESSRTRVGEELLLDVVRRNEGNGRRPGEVVEEVLELANLELGAELDPRLLHESFVLLHEPSLPSKSAASHHHSCRN